MKPLKILCLTTATIILMPLWLQAGEGEFDTEKILSDLEKQLEVSQEELEKLKPVLERKSRELKGVIHDSVDRGFAELDSMARDLEAASEKAGKELEAALDSEQVKELKAYLGRLDKEALDEIRRELVAEMEAFLELTGEQARELEPVLKEQLEKMSDLIAKFAGDSGLVLEEFRRDYAALAWETRERLGKALKHDQMQKLEKRIEESREKIRRKLFPDG